MIIQFTCIYRYFTHCFESGHRTNILIANLIQKFPYNGTENQIQLSRSKENLDNTNSRKSRTINHNKELKLKLFKYIDT